MIDEELRRMFTEREPTVPPAAPVASRITDEVARRRRRVRIVQATAGLVGLALVVAAVPVSVAYWRGAATSPPGGPAATSGPTAGPSPTGGLVPAPPFELSLPVTPGWLPEPFREPTSTNATIVGGTRSAGYQTIPRTAGVERVEILTRPTAPSGRSLGPDSPNDGVGRSDRRTVDVRGRTATQNAWTLPGVDRRTCILSWSERPDLWVVLTVEEKTRDMSLARAVECAIGRRVAREIRPEAMPMARSVRATLVPAGYALAWTGTQWEGWCPPGGDRPPHRCLTLQDGRELSAGPSFGEDVTVHGHTGRFNRRAGVVVLIVPGYLRVATATPAADEAIAHLSNVDMIRIAEATVLPRPW